MQNLKIIIMNISVIISDAKHNTKKNHNIFSPIVSISIIIHDIRKTDTHKGQYSATCGRGLLSTGNE